MGVMPYPKGVNARRLELIDKKYRQGGLTPDEQEELNGCARVMNAFLTQSPAMGERRDVMGEFEVFMDNMRRRRVADGNADADRPRGEDAGTPEALLPHAIDDGPGRREGPGEEGG